jgi:hypothetical protein
MSHRALPTEADRQKAERDAFKRLSAQQSAVLGNMCVKGLLVDPEVVDEVLTHRGLGHLAVGVLPERVEATMIVEALDVVAGKFTTAA